ncbi:MAG TPA: aminotransferase class I/II-fold pyridoxal phosphate-dependent enzyme [Terriglobales bacterium]|nr:aminotransferase class I/II-fold pyridoxal phosphate-dependent enzyme [Terriglobales bacterium]
MTQARTRAHSPYMEFAKLRSTATYNLATSGVMGYPLAELPVRLQDLEINGPTIYGYAPLQERLAKKNAVSPDCVVAAAGTSMANHLALAGILEPGDQVLIEDPTYELLLSAARYIGGNIRRFPRRFEDNFRVDPKEIEQRMTPATRLIVLTNLHNPSGALIDNETLREVGEIARRGGARVLVDEVYLEALFDQPQPSAFHLGNQFVVTSSLTKAYGLSGLRCGWILADPELASRIWRLNDLFAATPAHPAELLSVIALDHLDQVAARAKALIKSNRMRLDAFLDARGDLECYRPRFGTVVFPRLRRGSVDEFCQLLKTKYDTSVVPGRFFEMPEHFRIGIGGDPAMTAEGIVRLGLALDEFEAGAH